MPGIPTAERLVAAAREIVAAEGAAAVTMRRVAEAAGVTAMAIYRHYANREVLLRAVADATGRELGAAWKDPMSEGEWTDRYDALLDGFLDFALGQPHLYRFLMTDSWARARLYPDGFREPGSPPFTALVRLIEDGMREGVLRADDPLEAALTVSSQMQGMVLHYLAGRMGTTEPEFRELCRRTSRRVFCGLKA
ncbi:TetR/AcrR family transcriptional regulator [Amycolatopsis sp. FU40]|uniref:TetR/AcrR family transcriptional regulator n=1 Tax=Amycolatopsis sp. FU40 TaxID=2914159 RepID=UPI001F15A902|nr:TetR/AcrR family transcriptional regulator [Amycolatopsis sp. FU40]UKD54968.1 TetR/AcrR family transcriptional regulator [Amycolatopsis sp. FU40]